MPIRITLIVLFGFVCAPAWGQTVELFSSGNENYRVNATNRASLTPTVYDLDELIEIEVQTSVNLPSNPDRAREVAEERLTPQVQQQLIVALKAHVQAARYGLRFLPAIVIDGQFVYYGRDLDRALQLWKTKQ